MEGLSRLFYNAKEDGFLKYISISPMLLITLTLFVDAVILFGCGVFEEWQVLHHVLRIFCAVTKMFVSCEKSCFIRNGVAEEVMDQILGILRYKVQSINDGLKYLGYMLKPNNYWIRDWNWLIRKVERHIQNWCFRWLSLGGRLTLVK